MARSFTVIDYQIVRDEYASIHRTGCSAIEKDKRDHAGVAEEPIMAESAREVARLWANDLNADMGTDDWSEDCVKIHSCAR